VNRDEILEIFTKKSNANWYCPKCNKIIILKEGSINLQESSGTLRRQRQSDSHEMEYLYVFSCLFNCASKSCNEQIVCSGESYHDVDIAYDKHGNPYEKFPIIYRPKYFHPNVKLFPVSSAVPENMYIAVNKSFELYFCNYGSALNQLRVCIEILLESWGIPARENGRFVSLHERISKIPHQYNNLKAVLEAAKWLGNAGSHSSHEITKSDMLDAYEIINYVLKEVFESNHDRISNLANEINTNKGPRV
jgi:hypothetical protein